MAYQFTAGFDYNSTESQIWDTVTGTVTPSTGAARFTGTHSQGVTFASAAAALTKNLVGTQARVILGTAVKAPVTASNNNNRFWAVVDNGTTQVSLGINPSNVFQFYRGDPSGTPIGSAGSVNFTATVYHYVELDVTVHNTTGSVAAWLDGVQIINSTGLNTRNSSNNFATQVKIGDLGNQMNNLLVMDDVYCLDGTGGALNSQLGDRRIITVMAAASGSFSQFTPVGDSPNWKCVDEIPPDDDTTYVSDGTVNDRDSYFFETVVLNGNPDAVIPWARVKKDDAGSHTVQLSVRNGGVDAFSPSISVPSSYAYVNGGAFTTNPNGGGAWDQTGINGTEFGIKIIT